MPTDKFYTTTNTVISLGIGRCPLSITNEYLERCFTYDDETAALLVNQGHLRFITDEEVGMITNRRKELGLDK